MIKINKNKLYVFVVLVLLGFISISIKQPIICIAVAAIQIAMIVYKAKISIFSVFAVAVNFCFVQQYWAYTGKDVYGLLGYMSVPIYFFEMYYCICFFNIIILFFLYFSQCLENERKMFEVKVDIGFQMSMILIICAIIITILIFPSLPSLRSFTIHNRFNSGILSFSGWSCIPYFFSAIAIMNKKCRKYAIAAIFFIIFWYVFHGERVDALGLITLMMIKKYNEHRNDKATLIKIFVVIAIIVAGFVVVGFMREGMSQLRFRDIIDGILIQSTACDVTYVFNCAVDLTVNNEYLGGITYLSYLINCVPLLKDSYSFQTYILKYYYTAGGGLFFAEAIANFGIYFSLVFSFAYIYLITHILKKISRYRYMIYAALTISIFRTAWYGLNYPLVTILYFVPFIVIVYDFVSSKYSKKEKDYGEIS